MPRTVRFHKTGGPAVLTIEEVDVAAPGAGEVRIAVKAIGLNRAEAMYRSGAYLENPTFPSLIGYEASGIVEAVGPGVGGVQVGDRVSTLPGFSMNQYGTYGELILAPGHAVVKLPANLDWAEGAAIWMQYLTAWGALVDIASMTAGDFVLIPAASSSVGLAAIQICNLVGAIPIALTRSSAKFDELRKAGAAHLVATQEQDLIDEVKRITQGHGARIAFDPVGGPAVYQLTEVMSPLGILFQYGALSTEPTPLPLFTVLGKSLTIRGYVLFEFTLTDNEKLQRGIRFVLDGIAQGKLTPILSRSFPLEEIVAAHQFMESNQQVGKITVTV